MSNPHRFAVFRDGVFVCIVHAYSHEAARRFIAAHVADADAVVITAVRGQR